MNELIFNPKLSKQQKYLIAVSGGPDSMALFSEVFKSGYKIVVAHINYKMRKSADNDQKLVESYCKKNKIKLFTKTRREETTGNFQNWAREYRYDFFKQVYDKEKCNALLIAHHQDDKIETYIMKKQRPAIYSSVSLQDTSIIKGMNVIRPLLNYSKTDLVDYCSVNNIKYNIDESNLEKKYYRNKIRIEIINKLTEKSRKKYLLMIKKDQEKLDKSIDNFNNEYKLIVTDKTLKLELFEKLAAINKQKALYKFIIDNSSLNPRVLSKERLTELSNQLESAKPNLSIKLSTDLYLVKSYKSVKISNQIQQKPFSYRINNLKKKIFDEFVIKDNGEPLTGIHILKQDYPLTIRSFKSTDKINIKGGHKLVSRLFIDKKIPRYARPSVPVVLNAKGEILLISKLYVKPERKRLQSNLFVVKY